MKIPKSFKLLGHTVTVKVVPASEWTDDEAVGTYCPGTNEICLLANRPRSSLEHAFLHEAMHAILNAMGRDELYADEAFVDLASGLLHQVLTDNS